MKTLRLLLTFYKSFAAFSLLLTMISLFIIYESGNDGIYTLKILIWFKLFTIGLIYYFINSYKKNEYYLNLNLGISKAKLWIPILIFDFSIFILSAITLAAKLHETHVGG